MTSTQVTIGSGSRRQLSAMQRPLLVSQQLHPLAPLQNMALVSQFGDSIDHERLADAYALVVKASDVLRTQIVEAASGFEVAVRRDSPRSELVEVSKDELFDWAGRRIRKALDVNSCCYDSVILTHEDGSVSWYLNLHHIITDATSSAAVVATTAAAYYGSDVDLSSYYQWSDNLDLSDPRSVRALRHWQDRKPASRIGGLYSARPAVGSFIVDSTIDDGSRSSRSTLTDFDLVTKVESRLNDSFKSLNKELGWTTVLMSALSIYLHRITRAEEFSIGLPVHNRSDHETKTLVGPAMEVFPVDIRIEADDTFASVHRRVGKSIMKTMANAVPGTAPKADYEAVVNVILRSGIETFGSVPLTTSWIDSGAIDSDHMIRLQLTSYGDTETGPTIQADLNHRTAGREHRARFWDHFSSVLRAMVTDVSGPITEPSLVQVDEESVIAHWETEPDEPVVDIVERLRSSLAGSSSVVLEDDTQTWTGDELWQIVEAGAVSLRQQNIGAGDRVAVEMPRTAQTVQTILSVLVSGAAYVPIDPKQPTTRREDLVRRAGCSLVLTDGIRSSASAKPVEPVQSASPQDEAYVLFTSGSTGEPKGVPVTRNGLSRYISFAESRYRVGDGVAPVVPFFSSLTFDLTVTSLFLPLVAGGRLLVIEADGSPALQVIASRAEINWCKATPSHLEVLVRMLPTDHQLQTYVVGGEAFGSSLARRLFEHNSTAAIYNEYGPTEAVVGCMFHRATPQEIETIAEVPIGIPAPGVTLRIVDDGLQRVPVGSPGELLISHPGVTPGYLNETGTGAANDPFVELDGKRFYRSGDLVRLVDETTAVYLGRIDEQIKVGGIRLEPTEVEAVLETHPAIGRAAVRLWKPKPKSLDMHCQRCGLPSNVPGVSFDSEGICSTCREFDRVAPIAQSWFKSPTDLVERQVMARQRQTGKHDALLLLSGGKDSTFALYKLVELGFTPYALTLDNGFISEGAKENVRRSVKDLGIDHEFATSETMNAVFRESLAQFSNVCHGCYKTIYSLATHRAVELGIPMIVTGLSRGQLFETRLIPQQFDERRFDPDAIDRAVVEARKSYHRSEDKINRLLDTSVFESDDVFEQVEYVDFYRYLDVELEDMLAYLDSQAPWVRPADTGRSTNCLINAAGIFTHQQEQGYHNYAEPYAWDVRLGHKTRAEAMAELDDELNIDEVSSMLATVGYEPRDRSILTAWLEVDSGKTLVPSELTSYLAHRLPTHAIPSAFVTCDSLPSTSNGKLDVGALPAPERMHRGGPAIYVSPESEIEQTVVAVWERVLRLQPIGLDDDFFVLGGDSLGALEVASVLEEELGHRVDDAAVFINSTPRQLAEVIEVGGSETVSDGSADEGLTPPRQSLDSVPILSEAEQGILYDVALDPDSVTYNLGRRYDFEGDLSVEQLEQSLHRFVLRHQPFHWTYERSRRQLTAAEALEFVVGASNESPEETRAQIEAFHRRPFDLVSGPLLRCWVQQSGSSTVVALAAHHISADSETFDILWREVETTLKGGELPVLANSYAYEMDRTSSEHDANQVSKTFWLESATKRAAPLTLVRPVKPGPDGFIRRSASVSLSELTKNARGSGSVLTATAAAITLARYVDDEHHPVGIGFLASARTRRSARHLAGYFLNTLPLQFSLGPDAILGETVQQVRSTLGEALSHRSYPFARMIQDRRTGPGSSKPFEVLVAYDQLDTVSAGPGVSGTQQVLHNGTAVGPASLFVEVADGRVNIALEFSGVAMSSEAATMFLADFDAMLSAVAIGDAAQLVVELPVESPSVLIGPSQRPQTSLWSAISDHMISSARKTAIECGGQSLTWGEVERLSSAIAARLRSVGVVAGDRVVVALARSTMVLPAIVAVGRLGATYVPIDPTYPASRKTSLADRADAVAALVDAPTTIDPLTPNDLDVHLIEPESLDSPIGWDDKALDPDHVAYIIFTSGSTGEPKGVPVTNSCLAASTSARFGFYQRLTTSTQPACHPTRFLLLSSISFDSSIAGLFWTAASGGTLVVPTDHEVHNVDTLTDFFTSRSLSHTLLVPTLYESLLNRVAAIDAWPEHVIVAGEACSTGLVTLHQNKVGSSSLTNEYGPTEATVWASAAVVHHPAENSKLVGSDGNAVSIGLPIAGVSVAVVDHRLQPTPLGVEGQLVVGGAGVVGGYLPSASATSQNDSFVSLAWAENAFLTGDSAVVSNGALRFLGRTDDQLSLNGVRIEPGEIESLVVGLEEIDAAAVCVVDSRTTDDLLQSSSDDDVRLALAESSTADNPRESLRRALLTTAGPSRSALVAHIEVSDGSTLDLAAVRRRLSANLAGVMVPQRVVVQSEIPRLPNGKIDRAAIPELPIAATSELAESDSTKPSVGPQDNQLLASKLVDEVVGEFAAVVGHNDFGRNESFFDIGGHSLLAVELVTRIESRYQVELPIAVLYRNPSALDVASFLSSSVTVDPESVLTAESPAPAGRSSTTYLVPIQPVGSRTPIIGVHVLGINSEFYRPLSDRLGPDQPMFGVGQPVADLDTSRPSDVAEIAAEYRRELDPITSAGPVILAAVSLGSVVAFELATQLRRAGREVEKLVLFDAAGPMQLPGSDSQVSGRVRRLVNKVTAHGKELGKNPPKYVLDRSKMTAKRLHRRQEMVSIEARRRLGVGLSNRQEIRRFVEENIRSQVNYDFEPLSVPILVYKADDSFTAAQKVGSFGWASVAAAGVKLVDVPGGHLSMLAEPHVESLAQHCEVELAAGSVSSQLVDALHRGDFIRVLRRLARAEISNPADAELVRRASLEAKKVADSARGSQALVLSALVSAGIDGVAQPVAEQQVHHSFTVSMVDSVSVDTLRKLVVALGSVGFHPQVTLGDSERLTEVARSGAAVFVAEDVHASRAVLRWESGSSSDGIDGRSAVVTDQADLGVFVGTPISLVADILALVGVDSGDVVIDIGSGDGRVLIEAAKKFRCRGVGVEQDPDLVAVGRRLVQEAGVGQLVELLCGDAREVDLDAASVIFMFLPPEVSSDLLPELLARRSEGTVVVAHEQLAVAWPVEPTERHLVIDDGVTVVYIWR